MILVVDDEDNLRDEVADLFRENGYRVTTARDGNEAIDAINKNTIQLVFSDLRMPKLDGLELLRKLRAESNDVPFIMMTAFGSMDTAVEALRSGATDYLIKPVAPDDLLAKAARILENVQLKTDNTLLRRDLNRKLGPLEMAGSSPALEKVRELIRKVGPTRSSVLIVGESGTGKELVARAIHRCGEKNEPFVPVNCAAIPEALLESELFGHQRGSFTGAVNDSEGLFRSVRKGTLFLDEIGEMPFQLQAKLLRVLEDRMVHPVGSVKFFPFEGRVVAATSRDLKTEARNNKFREDLYYRLAVVEIHTPPLRARREDIPELVRFFIKKLNTELNRHFTGIEESALAEICAAPWRGNIRELQNVIERAMILGSEPLIGASDLVTLDAHHPASGTGFAVVEAKNLKDAVSAFEKAHVQRILAACENDKKKAAQELSISLSSLYRILGNDESE